MKIDDSVNIKPMEENIKKQEEEKIDPTTLYVVFYLIKQLNGVLGKTHLQKLLFLGDLLSVKKFKTQITSLKYQKHLYGPFSGVVEDYTKCLEEKGLIEIKELSLDDNDKYTRYYTNKEINIKPKLIEKIGSEKVLLLDEVIHSFGNMSLQEVLDIIYKLEIVKKTPPSSPLDFAKEIEEDREKEETL